MKKGNIIITAAIIVVLLVGGYFGGKFLISKFGETKVERTDTSLKVNNKGLKVEISPVTNRNVQGNLNLRILALPQGAKSINFVLYPVDASPDASGPNIIKQDSGANLGKTVIFDLKTVQNGEYFISFRTKPEVVEKSKTWITDAKVQIKVSN